MPCLCLSSPRSDSSPHVALLQSLTDCVNMLLQAKNDMMALGYGFTAAPACCQPAVCLSEGGRHASGCSLYGQLTCDYPGLYLHMTVIHLNTACRHAWWLFLAHVFEYHA